MDELLNKAKINDAWFKRELPRIVAYNFSKINEPCFYPEVKRHFYEFLRNTGLTEADIKAFTKRRWKGTKWASFQTHNEHLTNFYVFLLQYFIKKRDITTFKNLMYFYVIRQYANLMKKYFKYCLPESFKYALETLTKTHLFARERTIPNALMYIANESIRKFSKGLLNNDLENISYFMTDTRSRLNQSLKSFASTYHNAANQGLGMGTDKLPEDDDEMIQDVKTREEGEKLIDVVVKKLVAYRHFDRRAFEEAKKLSKINVALANQIVQKINNVKYSDNIRIILKLFLKDLVGRSASALCGPDYNTYVRNLMSVKRTKLKIFFKQQVNILLIEILKELRYSNKYEKMTSQTQFSVNLFLAYYLTMVLRNSVC